MPSVGEWLIQALQKLEEEFKLCSDKLRDKEEALNRVLNEKILLEQKISRLEKKNSDEVMLFLTYIMAFFYCFNAV